jgi:hypothetical protein
MHYVIRSDIVPITPTLSFCISSPYFSVEKDASEIIGVSQSTVLSLMNSQRLNGRREAFHRTYEVIEETVRSLQLIDSQFTFQNMKTVDTIDRL